MKIMSNNFIFDTHLFKQLLKAKLVNIRSVLVERIINIYVWAGSTIFVTGYLMQSFGLTQNFGPFQLAGILAAVGLFELYGNLITLVADIEGDCVIVYYLTLPSSIVTILLSYVCYFFIISMSMCFTLIPFSKLILWRQFNLFDVAWIKWLFFIVLINFFWAILPFVLVSYLWSIERLRLLWIRIIFPLWMFGGFQFSWMTIHSFAPLLSYVMLLNPVMYATEGIRAALLGQDGYISFWICFLVITLFCIITSWWGIKALKKRLDLV